MTHRDQVAQLVARDEIRQLAYRYAAALEARDVEAMVDLYSPDARFGEFGDGPDALRRLMTHSLDGCPFAVTLVANHLIDFDDDVRAHGQVWVLCFAQTEADGFVEQLIRYDDRYERRDNRWLFLHRKHRLWYGVGHPESPLRQPAANWPAGQIGVGDIPLSDNVFHAWWAGQP
ncbi:hypothetical protein A5698_13160 [Mycobacterium sp. E136]|uniref:nuclear transport factor 2 family protein n=1 Tax=Mycobacterium sp. E136 TaxID=1834125 RepID=UPI0007FC7AD1|nr:nuclear transport factor 2 family protein [Mycobacterium sp. E136]OBG97377.1 hypothetical protein A5698_13160 [Mycobacterium sp. E136]